MHRFWVSTRLGLAAVLFPLIACSCSQEAPNPAGMVDVMREGLLAGNSEG